MAQNISKRMGTDMRYADLCANIIFPIQEALKGHQTVPWLSFLEQSQWWTEEKLHLYSARKKEEFLAEVARYVPYYKNREMTKFMTKQDFRQYFNELKNTRNIPCHLQRTGGSTGEPLHFLISNERVAHDVAAKWRVTRWFDVDIGDKEWVFWGSPIELSSQSLGRKLRDYIFRSKLIPARNLNHDIIENILKQMQIAKPKILFGYPSILGLIAKYADHHKIKMNNLGIQVIFVTSEVLDPSQRSLMQDVFGCKVANGYGGRESGFIAHECPQGNMHITIEDIDVEIVHADGTACTPGEVGEVVITHLRTSAFPFIRYRTGDYAAITPSHCLCGRKLPLLTQLEGRRSDLIFTQNGSLVHRAQIVSIITQERDVERFQVIQQSLSCVLIKIKVGTLSKPAQDRIIKNIKQLLGVGVQVNIEGVDEFILDPSGKFRFVTSNVVQELL